MEKTMNNFEYYNPVRVFFGPGEVQKVGLLAKDLGKVVCLVSYKKLDFLEPLCTKVKNLLEKDEKLSRHWESSERKI